MQWLTEHYAYEFPSKALFDNDRGYTPGSIQRIFLYQRAIGCLKEITALWWLVIKKQAEAIISYCVSAAQPGAVN